MWKSALRKENKFLKIIFYILACMLKSMCTPKLCVDLNCI